MSHEPLETTLSYALSQAEQSVNRGVSNALNAHGLTIEQWRILTTLRGVNGITMSELADLVLLSLPTLTRAVDRMVSRALVYRRAHPTDRRKVIVYLSAAGMELFERVEPNLLRHENGILAEFGFDRAARLVAELNELANRMASRRAVLDHENR